MAHANDLKRALMDTQIPVITLKEDYNRYLQGDEVLITVNLSDNIFEGDHVLVYRDSIPVKTNIAVPREKQSEYIGVEGVVTKLIDRTYENESTDPKKQTLSVKII
jgi:hypothetical protein